MSKFYLTLGWVITIGTILLYLLPFIIFGWIIGQHI